MAERVTGWKLQVEERAELISAFPPVYGRIVGDHVTLKADAGDDPAPPDADGCIVGVADDGEGVQALVVAVDGSTDRPDGGTFHITWSLGEGRDAAESNAVIAKGHATAVAERPLKLIGARWPD